MSIPPEIDGATLVWRLRRFGYEPTSYGRSHERITHIASRGVHHLTLPIRSPLGAGTINQILGDVALHLGLSRDELKRELLAGEW